MPDDAFLVEMAGDVPVAPVPARTVVTAEGARSVAGAGAGAGESQEPDAGRMEAAQLEFDVQAQIGSEVAGISGGFCTRVGISTRQAG